MRKIHFILALMVGLCLSTGAVAAPKSAKMAQTTAISIGLVPPVQFPPKHFTVHGLRLSGIYGIDRKVRGLDIGLLGNSTDQEFAGAAIAGVLNLNHEITKVILFQIAGIANINKGAGAVYGIQAALGANLSPYMDVYGAQIGIYNRARDVRGIQIGLINYASSLVGIQIGLANFNEGGPFGVTPLINVGW